MGFWGYKPYVPVAKRREQALKAAQKAKKKGVSYSAVEPYRGALAKTFWGKAWCNNLESYSDYANRLPRGRTYVRNGSVIDLQISAGQVQALVMGSSLYSVSVRIDKLSPAQWKSVCSDCSSSVASLIELLQGKLSTSVMERVSAPKTGLFPSPKEMHFECSCPDWAGMCKHVAAALYGAGARLDQQPELLFSLRHVDAKDLVQQVSTLKTKVSHTQAKKILVENDLADVFGLNMGAAVVAGQAKPKAKKVAAKKITMGMPSDPSVSSKRAASQAVKKNTGKVAAKKAESKVSKPKLPVKKTTKNAKTKTTLTK